MTAFGSGYLDGERFERGCRECVVVKAQVGAHSACTAGKDNVVVAGIEVDQVPVVRNGMYVDCVSFDVGRASVDPDASKELGTC